MHPRRHPALLAVVSLGLLGCGDDGGGSATTASPGATAADDGAPDDGSTIASTSGTESSAGPAPGSDGASAGSSTADDGGATPCASNEDCAPAELCEFADHSCGVSGQSGACMPRPAECPADERPICGCDGELHASLCSAASAGVDVDFLGACELPNGAFACGFSFCILGDEYCLEQGGTMPSFECLALPPVCQPPDCSCITTCCGCANASCCSDYCVNEDDALTYTCPG